MRLRQSNMKHVTAENAKRCEYVRTETRKKMERLTAKARGVSPYFFDQVFDTGSSVYKVDRQS